MFPRFTERQIRIVGVALEGSDGFPLVVFEDAQNDALLSLRVDPFEAETVIREFTEESDDSTVAWLVEGLQRSRPGRASVKVGTDGGWRIRFDGGSMRSASERFLLLGDGLALCRRLSIPLYADERYFDASREQIAWLSGAGSFLGDFLYLSPPQYAPGIPVE